MRLTIEEYWTDVTPQEHHSTVSWPNGGGWTSHDEWKRGVKSRHGFAGFDNNGRAKFVRTDGIPLIQYVSLHGA